MFATTFLQLTSAGLLELGGFFHNTEVRKMDLFLIEAIKEKFEEQMPHEILQSFNTILFDDEK